jgi:hypothetical protein
MTNHIHLATGKAFKTGRTKKPGHFIRALRERPFKKSGSVPAYAGNFPSQLFMFGNGPDPNWPDPDGDGNCVSAGEAVNKTCAGIMISDATLYSWCVKNGTLNGADLEPVIQQMESAGFSQDSNIYGDGAPSAVDYTDLPTLQAALYAAISGGGGTVKCGVSSGALPSAAGNQNGWFMLTCSPDTSEDHNMEAVAFGTLAECVTMMNQAYPSLNLVVPSGADPTMPCIIMDTWGTLGIVGYTGAFLNFVDEAWLRSPSTVTTGTGKPTTLPVTVFIGLTPTPPANPLTVTVPAVTGTPGAAVTFSPSISGGTAPYTQTWAYGDGSIGTSPTWTYANAGTYTALLAATDSASPPNTATASCVVTIGSAPPPNPSGVLGSGTLADGTPFSMVPPSSVVPTGGAVLSPQTVTDLLADLGLSLLTPKDVQAVAKALEATYGMRPKFNFLGVVTALMQLFAAFQSGNAVAIQAALQALLTALGL